MHLWMSHIRDLEGFAKHHDRLLEAWQAGGTTGLVIGPPQLNLPEPVAHSRHTVDHPHSGEVRAAFDPDEEIYHAFGATVPDRPPAADDPRRQQIAHALTAAVDRGLELWIFDPLVGAVAPGPGSTAARMCDQDSRRNLAARLVDTIAAFPMATGVIIDGPAWGFEITEIPQRRMARRRLVFDEMSQADSQWVATHGFDVDRLVRARTHLWDSLHQLSDAAVAALPADDPDEAWRMLGGETMPEWLNFRSSALTGLYQHLTAAVRTHAPGTRVAVCPRQPAVARLAGHDLAVVADLVDVVMPKLYFWQRGYDGTIGIAHRWAETLVDWNPGLSARAASGVARALFGPSVPTVEDMIEFDFVLTPTHAGWLATHDLQQTRAAVGDRARLVPWIDTGRAPHDGDPLTAAHLDAILTACDEAAIDAATFFNSSNLTEADWTVLSHHCGTRWSLTTSDYLPADRTTL